ncbi:hypothetical protein VNI00_010386 [Paramarasmius palmivorus]|uniref:Uncharacterized protein n=1 Tax=Paramarasmius palmivorus TaxID=297713 RepID=A0AAW0CJH2_9AGAR
MLFNFCHAHHLTSRIRHFPPTNAARHFNKHSKITNLHDYTSLRLLDLLRPYEPITQIHAARNPNFGDTFAAFIHFLDGRVAEKLIQDVNEKTSQIGILNARAEPAAERARTDLAYSLVALWKGESRSVVWKVKERYTEGYVRKLFGDQGEVLHVEELVAKGGIWEYVVTYSKTVQAMQALSVYGIRNRYPVQFHIGSVQDTISSFSSESRMSWTSLNTVHIPNFVPGNKALTQLYWATDHLFLEFSELREDNVMSLRFSTSRHAAIFMSRLALLSQELGAPFSTWAESAQRFRGASSSRHRLLAIELGIARSICLSYPGPPLDMDSDPEHLKGIFSEFEPLFNRMDSGKRVLDHFDIDSAVAAITYLNRADSEGIGKVRARFHRYPLNQMQGAEAVEPMDLWTKGGIS